MRDVVEDANCVFREIDRAGDYGHDAFVLLVDGEAVTHVEVALQIKSGKSFCLAGCCRFSATPAQLGFWAGHGLTTIGIVYDPDAKCAWWIDLTQAAKDNRKAIGSQTISFPKACWNRFDEHGFQKVLIPALQGDAPRIDLAPAVEWATSDDFDTHDLGVRVLLARHREAAETWEAIFNQFRKRGAAASFHVIRGLIRIMGHTDEGYYSDEVPWSVRTPRQEEVLSFGKSEFIELLKFVEDGNFDRGSVGWGLLALIPPNPNALMLLKDIAADVNQDVYVSGYAQQMLAIYDNDPHWWGLWTPTRPYVP